MRLFIAIEFPDDIKRQLNRLRMDIPGARWVPVGQIHLTLEFLGEVDEASFELLTGELSAIQAPCFDVRFSATGCFPHRRQPRVLWVGLEPEPLLASLAIRVRTAVLASNIPQEERPFAPHITLARLKFPVPHGADAFLDQPGVQTIPQVSVREFVLFQSCLTSGGAIHTAINAFSLAP